ncbi:MAG: DUF5615 family PIN-like protein [Flavobacteriales bacterium]
MGFLCDVHISYKVVNFLRAKGYRSIHVNEILDGSRTKDSDICRYADSHDLILVSKDADFRDSFFLK